MIFLVLIQIKVLIFIYMNLQVCSYVHQLFAAARAQDSTMSAGFVANFIKFTCQIPVIF